ncbi:MAG TPA: sugar phosphate isomerase/epimerase family protein [Anaerolineae bacterium]|nr:sugar phosphate isomerase/epimerase family protein [Anaerolineae bacterium]HOQ99874.1 sugar phosphate isomerase/epimerase family protein [Anaerolineae bacterium]HPL27376.1 sugar phosphate isomerase/epimerase family protein [Anaerolineae bacterium]
MKLALTATPAAPLTAPLLVRGPAEEALRLAAELGYDGVELHLRRPEDIDRVAVAGLARSLGLGIPTLGTGMAAGEGLTFAAPNPEVRRRAVARIREHIALAAELGSGVTVGLVRGRLGQEADARAAARQAFVDCLDECCRAAAAVGVTLFLEPMNRYECDYLYTLDEASAVIDELGAPNLKLLADTFHMNIEDANLTTGIARAGGRLGHVHLVDSNRWVPGYGHLDVRGVLQALAESGYQGYLSFEALPLPDPQAAAREGLRTVRRILSGVGA